MKRLVHMLFGSKLFRDYESGCGFSVGENVRPRSGAAIDLRGAVEPFAVTYHWLHKPWLYNIVGTNPNPKSPADRFILFEFINGHDWERA